MAVPVLATLVLFDGTCLGERLPPPTVAFPDEFNGLEDDVKNMLGSLEEKINELAGFVGDLQDARELLPWEVSGQAFLS